MMEHDYLDRARLTLEQGRQVLNQNVALSITRSEEATEYALKAALLKLGITYEPNHYVYELFATREVRDSLPVWFDAFVPRILMVGIVFRDIRRFARYGNEDFSRPPSDIFRIHEAEAYLKNAEEIVTLCGRLFSEEGRP